MKSSFSDASQKRSFVFATILAILLSGCDSSASKPGFGSENPGFDALQTAIARRLAIMPAVARWKWEHGLPIEDRQRESQLIAEFVRRAEARGLNADDARRLIVDQMGAAKEIQRACFERWKVQPPPGDSPVLNLQTQLRPRIDRLTDELLDAAAKERSAPKTSRRANLQSLWCARYTVTHELRTTFRCRNFATDLAR